MDQTIERVRRMEGIFDILLEISHTDPGRITREAPLKQLLDTLTGYYESGQWLCDYRLDEAGALPKDLKRGVLSQDGVYDLLCSIEHTEKEQTPHEC